MFTKSGLVTDMIHIVMFKVKRRERKSIVLYPSTDTMTDTPFRNAMIASTFLYSDGHDTAGKPSPQATSQDYQFEMQRSPARATAARV